MSDDHIAPLLDRIDMHIEVPPLSWNDIKGPVRDAPETSGTVLERVQRARKIQEERFSGFPGVHSNSGMSPALLERFCRTGESGDSLMKNAMEKLGLSARACDRILKLARSIADLEGLSNIGANHIAEAIGYRSLDRKTWGG